MGVLRALTDGKISGTGTVDLSGGRFGGALISTDNTNAAVVIIRKENSSGKRIYDVSTITAGLYDAQVDPEGVTKLYYDISGTGASAQLYEWID